MSKKRKQAIQIDEKYLAGGGCGEMANGCGGCVFQGYDYAGEIDAKEKLVLGLLKEANIAGFDYMGIIPAPDIGSYRNKVEFSFGDDGPGGRLKLGMRMKGSRYSVSDGSCCLIADGDMRLIAGCINEYFAEVGISFHHKRNRTGHLRHAVIRKGFFTGEILINIVTTSDVPDFMDIAGELLKLRLSGKIMGILHTTCDTVADAVKPEEVRILHGRPFIYEKLLGLTFNITPFSFFQTNSAGAEKLYSTVLDFAGELTGKRALDLYCGTGTIAQLMAAGGAREVTGVELVGEAALSARENAKLNGLDGKCDFIEGDVLKYLKERDDTSRADLIVLDPPRDGLHPKALAHIIEYAPGELIYVACKPQSLARDLPQILESGYECVKVRICDMFPRTQHVETVCLLRRKPS